MSGRPSSRRMRVGPRLAVLLAGALLAGASSCVDFTAAAPPTLPDVEVATPSFASDVSPIFTARCSVVSCHTVATHQAGLVLDARVAYDQIVNVDSRLRPGMPRVRPFRPDSSLLYRVLQADPAQRFGIGRMPLGRSPLTDNQIATIRNWIQQGAPRN